MSIENEVATLYDKGFRAGRLAGLQDAIDLKPRERRTGYRIEAEEKGFNHSSKEYQNLIKKLKESII